MIRLVTSNQRGGVSKTASTAIIAREFADRGKRVLVVDTDSQGSLSSILGLKPKNSLYSFLIERLRFEDCITSAGNNIDVLCSNRDTVKVEAILLGNVAREFAFQQTLGAVEDAYDVILIDVSPSITLLQTCAMVYTEQVLIPVAMDTLSYQGAVASIEASRGMNKMLRTNIRTIGFLPVMVDRRLAMTATVLQGLESLSSAMGVPVLPSIRTDQTVTKAARAGQFLADYEPRAKAMEDYRLVVNELEKLAV